MVRAQIQRRELLRGCRGFLRGTYHPALSLFLQPDDLVVGKGCLDRPRPEALDAEALVHERGAILAQGVLPGIVEGR